MPRKENGRKIKPLFSVMKPQHFRQSRKSRVQTKLNCISQYAIVPHLRFLFLSALIDVLWYDGMYYVKYVCLHV